MFIKTKQIKVAFNLTFLEILRIFLEKQLLIKFNEIKHFNIAKTPKYDEYECEIASLVYKFFDKRFLVVVLTVKLCQTMN